MKTERVPDRGTPARLARGVPFFVVAVLSSSSLTAQTRWVTTLSAGTSPRLGVVPGSLAPRGSNWGANIYTGFRTARNTFATLNLGMNVQTYDLRDSAGARVGTHSFHSYVFGAGPTVVARPAWGFFGLVSLQPAMVVSFWGASPLSECIRCGEVIPAGDERQVDTRLAAAFSAQLGYQFVRRGTGRRTYGIALEMKGLAAPRHGPTGMPISQVGMFLSFVAGEP
jgi:hypothetical protein